MDINITKETLNVNKTVCEKKQVITVEGDMIVPDSKPDILNTINTSGNVCIYKKEIMDGKLRLDGNVLTHIIYFADGEKDTVRGLNTGIDFSEIINVQELTTEMEANINVLIKGIECKIVNGRKVTIKAILEVNMKIYQKQEIQIVTEMNNENIQVLNKNIKANSILGEGSTKTYIKENIEIPNTDNLAEILKMQLCLVDKDIKVSYNKIIAKSELEIKMVYLTEDGKVCTTKNRLSAVGFIDMPNIKDEHTCETTYTIKNIIIKPNAIEEHSVYIEVEIEINCVAYEEKEINLIQDMYCPYEKVDFDKNIVNTITNKKTKKETCNITEKFNIPELENGNIIDVEVNPIVNKEKKLNGKITFEGELEMNFIFTDNSTVGVNTKKINIPFEQTIDGIENKDDCNVETVVEVNSQEFTNQGGIINLNIDLNFEIDTYKNTEIPVIDNISIQEQENTEDYSVIIYVVKSGDTLWKIAKRYGSTVDDIVRVNGIENPDKINVGEKIYIPKYVLRKDKEAITI